MAMGRGKQMASSAEKLPWKIQKQDLPALPVERALLLPYIEPVPQGEDIVMEDQPVDRPIKEKKEEKPPQK